MPKDPRIGNATVNEILQNLAIRHGISIEKFKSSEVKKLLDILAEADAKALQKLERRIQRLGPVERQLFGNGRYATERLIAVREAIDEVADRSFEIIHGNVATVMTEVGKAEYLFQAGAVAATVDLKVDWITPSNTLLRTLVRAKPFNSGPTESKILRQHTKQWSRGIKERVTAALTNSLILGEAMPETTAAVAKILETSKIGAERIARTGIAHITNAARESTYEANKDIILGIKIVTTLDTRRCKTCMYYEGRVYPVGSGPRPIFHYVCRCLTVPVIKASAGRGIRASSKGEVPANITTDQFMRKLNKDEQEDVLGVTGRKLWLKGKLPLDGFVDKSGNPFTLDDLARKNAEEFKRAGLDPKDYRSAA